MAQPKLDSRVAAAAEAALRYDKSVSPIDVLNGIGWLPGNLIDKWRRGQVATLEDLLTVHPDRLASVLELLDAWARSSDLVPVEVQYLAATRDNRPLRFTRAGDEVMERAFRTHWTSPELSDARRQRMAERQSRAPDLLVIEALNKWTCTSCGDTGPYLRMENGGPVCLTCADLDHLVFLPAGNAALSRRAKKESSLSAVVVRFSKTRKRYERQGILVEEAAVERAEEQCLADADVRERRRERGRVRRAEQDAEFQEQMAEEILVLFPGCPPERASAIAHHAALRGSGRVGRTAAARALDPDAITLAVVASVRHQDTKYDDLLMSGHDRADARERVRPRIDAVLDRWRGG